MDRDCLGRGRGDTAQPAGALGEDGLLRSGHSELGMWTVRLVGCAFESKSHAPQMVCVCVCVCVW